MDMIGGVGMIALSLVLVGSAIVVRRRAGQPIARYALIWTAIVAIGFAVALAMDHRPR